MVFPSDQSDTPAIKLCNIHTSPESLLETNDVFSQVCMGAVVPLGSVGSAWFDSRLWGGPITWDLLCIAPHSGPVAAQGLVLLWSMADVQAIELSHRDAVQMSADITSTHPTGHSPSHGCD